MIGFIATPGGYQMAVGSYQKEKAVGLEAHG
jgi:hypothetical protein